jgi:hypothetical protein
MLPWMRPESAPDGWAEWGGMYRYRFCGFSYRVVEMCPGEVIVTVRSIKLHAVERGMKSHSRPCLCCMVCWKECQMKVF